MEANNPVPKKKNRILPIMLVLIIGSSLFFGINKYRYSLSHEDTDDAQIDGDISPVYSRVAGYINAVLFEDNQHVNKGDTLVMVDDRDLQIKVQQAEAAIANAAAAINVAKAAVETARGNVVVAQSGINASNVRLWKAKQDYDRFNALVNLDATTKQKFDAAKADKENAEALLESSKSQLIVAQKQVNAAQEQVTVAEAQLVQRKVELDLAKLQITYTVIISPASGTVSKKNVQTGQLVNVGSPLCSIVGTDGVYVIANFKETQLKKMKEGQLVDVKVDAFPDEKITGKIYRFSAATGAKFSLLPPDNATGNYVKVVQRIPVKIKIESSGEILKRLRPGMSVKVAVELN
jgi:membrane fusion protein (multidrug efflux system)